MKGLELLDLVPDIDDDVAFLNIVKTVIVNVVGATGPSEVFVVKIRNWFGWRWLGFSGKALGALRVAMRDATIPPFVPSRVLSQVAFRKAGDGYQQLESSVQLHVRQPSSENLNRRLSRISPRGAFFWFSSGSKTNGRASLMGYAPTPLSGGHLIWYLEFKRDREWSVAQARGIGGQEVEEMLGTRHETTVV